MNEWAVNCLPIRSVGRVLCVIRSGLAEILGRLLHPPLLADSAQVVRVSGDFYKNISLGIKL